VGVGAVRAWQPDRSRGGGPGPPVAGRGRDPARREEERIAHSIDVHQHPPLQKKPSLTQKDTCIKTSAPSCVITDPSEKMRKMRQEEVSELMHHKEAERSKQVEAKHYNFEKRCQQEYDRTHPNFVVNQKEVQEIFNLLNKVRATPELYLNYLQKLLDDASIRGHTLCMPGTGVERAMTEGAQGCKLAMEVLKRCPKLPEFTLCDGLSKSCYDLIRDHNPEGLFGHALSDGTIPEERLNHYGKLEHPYEEFITYDYETPELLVLNWFLDDGDFSRRRRNSILNPKFNSLGIAVGPHAGKNMVVAVFACNFSELKHA